MTSIERLDIVDYSVYANEADRDGDARLAAAAMALGCHSTVEEATPSADLPSLGAAIWLRYDLRTRTDLEWITAFAAELERQGRTVFPPSCAILLAEDKWESYRALKRAEVPTVSTYPGEAWRNRRTPGVVKPRVGWGGAGMVRIDNGQQCPRLPLPLEDYVCQPFIPHDRTLTVAAAGQCVIDTLEKRPTPGNWRSDGVFGHEARPTDTPREAGDLAVAALAAIGLAAGTVDLINDTHGLVVLEVNSALCLWYPSAPRLDLAGPMMESVLRWMTEHYEDTVMHAL